MYIWIYVYLMYTCVVYVCVHACVFPGTYVLKPAIQVAKAKKNGGMRKARSEPLFLAELRDSQPHAPSIPNKHQSFGCVLVSVLVLVSTFIPAAVTALPPPYRQHYSNRIPLFSLFPSPFLLAAMRRTPAAI